MFRDTAAIREYCYADKNELKELTSWRRPVVILKQKKQLSASVSNGLRTTAPAALHACTSCAFPIA
jgi:hydrogenase maturation protein HypF